MTIQMHEIGLVERKGVQPAVRHWLKDVDEDPYDQWATEQITVGAAHEADPRTHLLTRGECNQVASVMVPEEVTALSSLASQVLAYKH
jgi:hypothetical protein